MRPIAFTTCLVLLTAALSGCFAEEAPEAAATSTTQAPAGTNQTTPTTNATQNETGQPPVANLTADLANGSAPLAVTFVVANEGPAEVSNWTLEFGDGNATAGVELGNVTYTYNATGTHNATLTLYNGFGNSTDTVQIEVAASAPSAPPPSKLTYNSGPVLGCVSEAGYENCPAYVLGPGGEEGFGLWIVLEPGHIGMQFTTTSTAGDSDGWIFADPEGAPLVNVSNGGGEAEGLVPVGATHLLIVSWATPSDDMEVVFSVAPPPEPE